MKISNAGIDFLKLYEGFKANAYQDGAGVWTIGYGTTVYPDGGKVKAWQKTTIEEATAYLKMYLSKTEKLVNALLTGVVLRQTQFDAIVALVYNIGPGAFSASTVLKYIKENPTNYNHIGPAWTVWNKIRVNGQLVFSQGLMNRRIKEFFIYQSI